jgi:uncharacterized protein (DUF1499 family)
VILGALAATLAVGVIPRPAAAPRPMPTEAELRAMLKRGSSAGVTVTDEHATDPRLEPRRLLLPPPIAQAVVVEAIRALPRWRVAGTGHGVVWATHTSRFLHLVDDLYILLEPEPGSTAMYVRSASRAGSPDFGQNRRNLGELWRGLERWMDRASAPAFGDPALGAVLADVAGAAPIPLGH